MESKREWVALGVMSGSSLDGVDLCLVRFTGNRDTESWTYEILAARTISYTSTWQQSLMGACELSGEKLIELDRQYAHHLSETIRMFLAEVGERLTEKLDCITVHGHTVFHQPSNGFTYQLGDGETMVAALPCPLVCNLRSKDVALGGQGAPLVPVGERYLFREHDIFINLGGVCNISGYGLGFDVCMCNVLLNYLAGLHDPNLEYDRDGQIAASGTVCPELLTQLNGLPHCRRAPPKSLGREDFETFYKPLLNVKVRADIHRTKKSRIFVNT